MYKKPSTDTMKHTRIWVLLQNQTVRLLVTHERESLSIKLVQKQV